MISAQDVIILKMPYPSISAELALKPHMYICYKNETNTKKLIKSQTFKLSMITTKKLVYHYVIEDSDINRNPFLVRSLIDCDKLFIINVNVPLDLLTSRRRNVCIELFNAVEQELLSDGYISETIDTSDLKCLNYKIK